MGHPDFRANGRIFATLYPDGERGMVQLSQSNKQSLSALMPQPSYQPAAPGDAMARTTVRLRLSMKTSSEKR